VDDELMYMSRDDLQWLLRWVRVVCWAQTRSAPKQQQQQQQDEKEQEQPSSSSSSSPSPLAIHNFTSCFADGRAFCLLVRFSFLFLASSALLFVFSSPLLSSSHLCSIFLLLFFPFPSLR
jgi:hypothetical protein